MITAPLRAQQATPAPAPAPSSAAATLPDGQRGSRLEYSAAPGCPDEETFHHAVASFVEGGVDPFDASSPDLLRVTFAKVAGGYRGTVQKTPEGAGPWAPQVFTASTCEEAFHEVARISSSRALSTPKDAPAAPAPEPTQEQARPPEPSSALPKPPSDPVPSQGSRVAPASFADLPFMKS